MIVLIAHIHIARQVNSNPNGGIKPGSCGSTVDITIGAISRQCAHYSGRGYLANYTVKLVGYINISGKIGCHAGWMPELCSVARTIYKAQGAGSCKRGNNSSGAYFPHNIIVEVGNINISKSIGRHTGV